VHRISTLSDNFLPGTKGDERRTQLVPTHPEHLPSGTNPAVGAATTAEATAAATAAERTRGAACVRSCLTIPYSDLHCLADTPYMHCLADKTQLLDHCLADQAWPLKCSTI